MAAKTLDDYTTQDLCEWINNEKLPSKMKNEIKATLTEECIDGSCLIAISKWQELEDFGFAKYLCPKLLKLLNTMPKPNNNSSNDNNSNNSNSNANIGKNNNKKKFFSSIFSNVKSNEGQTTPQGEGKIDEDALFRRMINKRRQRDQRNNSFFNNNYNNKRINNNNSISQDFKIKYCYGNGNYVTKRYFTVRDTVATLKQCIADSEGGDIDNLELLLLSKVMHDYETLGQLGFNAAKAKVLEINVSFRVDGGSEVRYNNSNNNNNNNNDSKNEDENKVSRFYAKGRERIPDFENEKNIKPTFKEDCLMGYNDKLSIRVQMPCGHVFAPITLFRLAKMIIEDHSKTDFECPECHDIWSFALMAAAADFDDNESRNFGRILTKRKAVEFGEYKICANCQCLVKRPDKISMKRVRCSNKQCKRGDFCWLCDGSWKGGGFLVCGNNNCTSNKINDALKSAKLITPSYRPDAQCPDLRACPRCLVLVRYKSACKHMPCWNCRKKFCFMCLSLQNEDETWNCDGGDFASGKCPCAERQNLK